MGDLSGSWGQAFILHFPEPRNFAVLPPCHARCGSVPRTWSTILPPASAVSNIRRRLHQNQADVLPGVDRLPATIREAESATTQSVK